VTELAGWAIVAEVSFVVAVAEELPAVVRVSEMEVAEVFELQAGAVEAVVLSWVSEFEMLAAAVAVVDGAAAARVLG
jgi:adenosine/AMP kinase